MHPRDLFISHASADSETALGLVAELERSGISCWLAVRDVALGSAYQAEIVEAIERCRAVLLLFSNATNKSEHVLREMELAAQSRKAIYPVRLGGAEPTGGLKYLLINKQWVERKVLGDRLVETIEQLVKPGGNLATPSRTSTTIGVARVRRQASPLVIGTSIAGFLLLLLASWSFFHNWLPGAQKAEVNATSEPIGTVVNHPPARPVLAPIVASRRAFIVGVQRYGDGNIQQLSRTLNDAQDLASDLEQTGFDKKKITLVENERNKASFEKDFNSFLATIEAGDTVFFYFSGHGVGIEPDQNYLLLADVRSPFEFTRSQLPQMERGNPDIVRLRMPSFMDEYQRTEIPMDGVSVTEIQKKLAAKNPKYVFMILDARRALVSPDGDSGSGPRRAASGEGLSSLLTTVELPPPGFFVLFSASNGEQAVERFDLTDNRRNSLFTEVLRSELQRPGQSLMELAKRVRLVVRSIAGSRGLQQEPEYIQNLGNSDELYFVEPIGSARFQLTQDRCADSQEDWKQIGSSRNRDLVERHRRRFDGCETGELARRALLQFAVSSDDTSALTEPVSNRPVNECDSLAASEVDPARPPEVRGVFFDRIDSEAAIAACQKAVQDNPRVVRYLFNLGRAYHRLGTRPGMDQADRSLAFRRARLAYNDAASRGYVSALNNLAILYEGGDGVDFSEEEAIKLFTKAAQQGHPLAMYNLAHRYKDGTISVRRSFVQAAEWFMKSAETGFVPAMVEVGNALRTGLGLASNNPMRAMQWYQRAAESGSTRAMVELGKSYLNGIVSERAGATDRSSDVEPDPGTALMWFARAADAGDATAQAFVARMLQDGAGAPNSQPEVAGRYWRMAAHGGNRFAQVELSDQLRRGLVPATEEHGTQEGVELLRLAMVQGSPRAALSLAQVYRKGELGQVKNSLEAMKLGYRAIELTTETDPALSDGNPYYEFAAGQMLVEMSANGEAVDGSGHPLLTQAEIERLQHYYGKPETATKTVNVRRFDLPLLCGKWERREPLWVWDWDRPEPPTEPQFRYIDYSTGCIGKETVRRNLIELFDQAKIRNVPFVYLVDQKIKIGSSNIDDSDYTGKIKAITERVAEEQSRLGGGASGVTEYAVAQSLENAFASANLAVFESFIGENWSGERMRSWLLTRVAAELGYTSGGNSRGIELMAAVDSEIQRSSRTIYRRLFELSEFIAASRSAALFLQRLYQEYGGLSQYPVREVADSAGRKAWIMATAKFQQMMRRDENGTALRYRAQRIVLDCLSNNVDRIVSSTAGIATAAEIEERIVNTAMTICVTWLDNQFGANTNKINPQIPVPLRAIWSANGPLDDPSMYGTPRGRL
jgi:TPR repeat protein